MIHPALELTMLAPSGVAASLPRRCSDESGMTGRCSGAMRDARAGWIVHDRRVRIVCHPEADAAYIFSTDEALIQASILAGIAITIGLILVVIPGPDDRLPPGRSAQLFRT